MNSIPCLLGFSFHDDTCRMQVRIGRAVVLVEFEKLRRSQAFLEFLKQCPSNAPLLNFIHLNEIIFSTELNKIGFRIEVRGVGKFSLRFDSVSITNSTLPNSPQESTSSTANAEDDAKAKHEQSVARERVIQQTALTHFHLCTQCNSPLKDANNEQLAIGKTKATVTCLQCDNRTSVYTVIYRCEGCNLLLETPSRMISQTVHCTNCDCRQSAPDPRLLCPKNTSLINAEEGFLIKCPSCKFEWATNRINEGARTVCGECHVGFVVPKSGMSLSPTKSGFAPLRSCRRCQHRIPLHSTICPVCNINHPVEARD